MRGVRKRKSFVRPSPDAHVKLTATYLSTSQRRSLEEACERAGVAMAVWIRRLIVSELSRLAVRKQLEASL